MSELRYYKACSTYDKDGKTHDVIYCSGKYPNDDVAILTLLPMAMPIANDWASRRLSISYVEIQKETKGGDIECVAVTFVHRAPQTSVRGL